MEALGMIETRGLLAAIEAADVMTKSANIKILEKIYIGGGLVSITICGDIGAVKSSIDIGEIAVNNLGKGLLVSKHMIARPHTDLKSIIKLEFEEKKETPKEIFEVVQKVQKEIPEEIQGDINSLIETDETNESSGVKIIERVDKENIDKQIQEIGIEKSKILLRKLKLLEIRELIKEYSDLELTDKFISKSNKKTLVKKIIEHYSKN